jgi:hypothetical protein
VKIRFVPMVLLVIGLVSVVASGCSGDLYGQCQIDEDDALLIECANSTTASCIVEEQLECETRICGKYQGSAPFCTIECSSDGDCPSGRCREFVFQSNRSFCVAEIDL